MKKIVLLFLYIHLASNVNAQSWCPPGATWYYKEYNGVTATDGIIKFQYVRDTLINSITAKLITGTFSGKKTGAYPYPSATIYNYASYITYEANKVVYLHSNGNFDTVVNYNATIGDKWRCLSKNNACGLRRHLTVTDTGHVLVNGLFLKTLVMTDTNKTFATPKTHTALALERVYNFTGTYAEDVLFRIYCDAYETGGVDHSLITFLCYFDDTFLPYSNSSRACNITGQGSISQSVSELFVHPNPVNNHLRLLIPELMNTSFDITLTNNLGQKINVDLPKFISREEMEINLSNIASGIYFIQIFDQNKLIAKTKVIKD